MLNISINIISIDSIFCVCVDMICRIMYAHFHVMRFSVSVCRTVTSSNRESTLSNYYKIMEDLAQGNPHTEDVAQKFDLNKGICTKHILVHAHM
jgi:hypothetical protein